MFVGRMRQFLRSVIRVFIGLCKLMDFSLVIVLCMKTVGLGADKVSLFIRRPLCPFVICDMQYQETYQ